MIDVDLARRRDVDAGRISVIELNRSGPDQAAVALLAFLDGGPAPIAFLKITPDADRAAALAREFDNLTRLRHGGSAAFRRSLPEPLYCERLDDLTVLAETATAGTRMKDFPPDRYFASSRFRDHLSLAVRWLVEFHEAFGDEASTLPADAASREVDRYRATHPVSPALNALLDETAHRLDPRRLPLTPSHGDFCTANVMVPEGDGLFVIDWEYPLARTWPLSDLLYFVASTWCIPYAKGREALRANYRQLFFTPHAFADLLRDSTSWYAGQLGVPTADVLFLSAVAWTGFANRKHDDLARARAAGATPDEAGHLPLMMIEDGACLNLELLAAHRDAFALLVP